VIVGTQTALLDAAVAAGVPRFVPSDFSTNFTKLPVGENRNFDLRREFHNQLDVAPIAATAIFNGAFGEILAPSMNPWKTAVILISSGRRYKICSRPAPEHGRNGDHNRKESLTVDAVDIDPHA
jgi:hypothetical protein